LLAPKIYFLAVLAGWLDRRGPLISKIKPTQALE
jgi:hypothetical protein